MRTLLLISLGMPSVTLLVVVVSQCFAWFVFMYLGIQQQLQAQIFVSIPAALCVLYAIVGLIRVKLNDAEVKKDNNAAKVVNSQLKHIWGPSFDALETLVGLAEKRIQEAQQRLQKGKQGNPSSLFEIARTGYKSIQVARAILVLCRGGYPDQAYILCRALVEQRVNIGFILTSGKLEEVAQRFLDWEKVKFYRFIKRTKARRDKMNRGPTAAEWADLTDEYQRIKAKYAGDMGDIDEKEEWAIAYRDGLTRTIKAFNVADRARHSMPCLVSDEDLLFDAWEMEWQDLNEFTHTTPRSLNESMSSPGPNVVVSGASSIGIYEPASIAGREILNLSSVISHNLTPSQSSEAEKLGSEAMELHKKLLEELQKIPPAAFPWYQRSAIRDS